MQRILPWIRGMALLAAVFALIQVSLLCQQWARVAQDTSVLITDARSAVAELRQQSREQLARLRDPRNSKAIDAGIQTMAVFNGTGRLINRELIPRAMGVLDNLSNAAASLDKAVQATDKSVNGELLPESKRLLAGTTDIITATQKSAEAATTQIIQAGNDIHALLADPALKLILAETSQVAAHADGIAANLEDASKQMPLIAADLERIAATSSRYRKAILISQILSALGRAFF